MERLDLNFRAEPAQSKAMGFASGWWLWCLVGVAAGFGVWWTSRQYLARRLSDQLATAQSPSEAFLALEGLLMLDSTATLEIARGLQHPNAQVARTAYRTLDAQISGWSQLESSIAAARMRTLSQRLSELPETTPPDNLVLASSLASRIFSICLELDDPQLAPVMTACETVFYRIGRATDPGKLPATVPVAVPSAAQIDVPNQTAAASINMVVDEQLGKELNALRPPPPLSPTKSAEEPSEFTLSDEQTAVPPLAQREVLHSSSSTPMAQVPFLTSTTRARPENSKPSGASASLSDDTESSADTTELEMQATPPQPSLVHGPASIESQPLPSMQHLKVEVELENIQRLDIDQLVRLLASVQPRVAQAAALTLRAKGFPDDRLTLASELATAAPAQQISLLQSIATRTDLDPRPWLLWMAEDGPTEVKQQAIVLLSSMKHDITVQRDLRRLSNKETDEQVAQAIRQLLILR